MVNKNAHVVALNDLRSSGLIFDIAISYFCLLLCVTTLCVYESLIRSKGKIFVCYRQNRYKIVGNLIIRSHAASSFMYIYMYKLHVHVYVNVNVNVNMYML